MTKHSKRDAWPPEQKFAIVLQTSTMSELRIPVVRVVVPGLEAALEGPDADYVPGERAMRILEDAP